jgi:hypothetical protein
MDFELGNAVLAGLIGGAAMAVILYMGILMLPRQMKMNLFMMLGSMVLPVGAGAFLMGAMVHLGMSVVFGLVHAAAFSILGIDSDQAAWGLLFGLVHWAVVGMALGMLPLMHPRIRYGGPRLIAAASGDPRSEQLLDPPGFYALGYPAMTALGFLMLHLLFGLIVGALYGAWA